MKQKIVIKVQMNCEKCRTKAMSVVASVYGTDSVAFEGEERDHLVVQGDGVDPVNLTSKLRKKVGHAKLVRVEEIKKDDKKKNESKVEGNEPKWESSLQWYPPCNPVVVYDLESEYRNPNICSIL